MRRALIVVLGAGVVVACVLTLVIGLRGPGGVGGPEGDSLTAQQLPYPRATKPLPVPEAHIGELPWRQEVGLEPSSAAPMPRPTDDLPACGQQGKFRFCRSG
ncbi:hypothetical protein [Aeromicrobium wangtongii]|uniref:Uncharacterized protein n=1 Tax=Aeromicrobium wangtongii TaxID=2969247 RepID=A0ABY5MDK1_9ACTN|nr:hypothetical protein [Aeromicrobium wangtongii]MCD9197828.1 hypothetical protein [Aeromicrobium wangtongii]UUP15309.1 hypothetical protein NQV15_08355 [Aeromicrobium wangtongii]